MNKKKKLNRHNIFFILIFTVVVGLYSGRKSHYWGLQNRTTEEIIFEVGMGYVTPSAIKLTLQQRKEITELILKNPENFNDSQKELIFGKSGKQILTDVGMGYIKPYLVKLTLKQRNEIKDLIQKNPQDYNDGQKELIFGKSGKQILIDVGMGYIKPDFVKLTLKQRNEIKELILKDPENYNDDQKFLIFGKSGQRILTEVGMGNIKPDSVKLTPKQRREIEELINKDPDNYNAGQKALLN